MNVREAVRPLYDRLKVGLSEDWSFSKNLTNILDLDKSEKLREALHYALDSVFLILILMKK